MVKIAIYPADNGGCGSYRLIWPALAVADQYKDCEILIGESAPEIRLAWDQKFDGHPVEWATVIDAYPEFPVDIMVFQRPLHKEMANAFKFLRQRGIKIVIDLDDNFDNINPRNMAWFGAAPFWHTPDELQRYANKFGTIHVEKSAQDGEWLYCPAYKGRTHRLHIHEALRHCDLLTSSTKDIYLNYKNYIYKDYKVLHNCIPQSYLDVKKPKNTVPVVGWTGTVATHPEDLKQIGSALKQLKSRTDFVFKIIGDGFGIEESVGIKPDEVIEWVDLNRYPQEYGTFDIALCPLNDERFNRSKSWLKPLEAAAVGAVPVMSPLPEYEALEDLGIGLLAKRPREWETKLSNLMNEDIREFYVDLGRHIAARHTIESNAWRWHQAWTNTL